MKARGPKFFFVIPDGYSDSAAPAAMGLEVDEPESFEPAETGAGGFRTNGRPPANGRKGRRESASFVALRIPPIGLAGEPQIQVPELRSSGEGFQLGNRRSRDEDFADGFLAE